MTQAVCSNYTCHTGVLLTYIMIIMVYLNDW